MNKQDKYEHWKMRLVWRSSWEQEVERGGERRHCWWFSSSWYVSRGEGKRDPRWSSSPCPPPPPYCLPSLSVSLISPGSQGRFVRRPLFPSALSSLWYTARYPRRTPGGDKKPKTIILLTYLPARRVSLFPFPLAEHTKDSRFHACWSSSRWN